MNATQQATATYTHVTTPMQGNACRNYGHTHAAVRTYGGYSSYKTLCGKLMTDEDFKCFADESHTITCAKCKKALGG